MFAQIFQVLFKIIPVKLILVQHFLAFKPRHVLLNFELGELMAFG